MPKLPLKYKFQFGGDVAGCRALETMINDGWEVETFEVGDGYHWINLVNWMSKKS